MGATLLDLMGVKIKEKVLKKQTEANRNRYVDTKKYTDSYCLQLLAQDIFIFDVRFWPDGVITKEYVKKCFETGSWHTNAGHFNWVMSKRGREITWKEFWRVFQREKLNAFGKFISGAKSVIERQQKLFADREMDKHHKDSIVYEKEAIVAYTKLESHRVWKPMRGFDQQEY